MPVHHATDAQTLNAIIQQNQSVVIKIHADWHDNSRKLANFFEEIAGQRPQMAFVVAHVDKIPLEQVTQCQGTWIHYRYKNFFWFSGIKNAPGKLPSWYYMFNGQQFEYLEGSDYKAVVKAVFRLEALQ